MRQKRCWNVYVYVCRCISYIYIFHSFFPFCNSRRHMALRQKSFFLFFSALFWSLTVICGVGSRLEWFLLLLRFWHFLSHDDCFDARELQTAAIYNFLDKQETAKWSSKCRKRMTFCFVFVANYDGMTITGNVTWKKGKQTANGTSERSETIRWPKIRTAIQIWKIIKFV